MEHAMDLLFFNIFIVNTLLSDASIFYVTSVARYSRSLYLACLQFSDNLIIVQFIFIITHCVNLNVYIYFRYIFNNLVLREVT